MKLISTLGIIIAGVVLTVGMAIPASTAHNPVYARAKATTHILREAAIVDGGQKCSATAIGPHAILTASHCELPTDILEVDTSEARIVVHPMRDGLDHTIYVLDETFPVRAKFATEAPQQGDDFFYFGNPGLNIDYMRKGYFVGFDSTAFGVNQYVMDANGFYGDSGAAVFNNEGEIVTLMSQMATQKTPDNSMKMIYGWPFAFSQKQLERAAQ